ncbi:MAG: pyrroloquinoline quinone biosynthesis protein PqqB [Pseudorhodobacter sp.]|nr:pyrroloquinoline quinone biosynthesis protein PqqB [Pseudorhodobacter sp.]
MLKVVILGSAAGGALPQWNCNCAVCAAAWADPALRNTQVSVAVSADGEHWFLINASPDIRQQILQTPALHPAKGHLRHSPIAGIILTNGEIDAIAGLLSLREGSPFGLYAHPRVLQTLAANSVFDVLNPQLVPRLPMKLDEPFEPHLPGGAASGLMVQAFAVPGKPAWYIESAAADPGDTIGLKLWPVGGGDAVYIIAACAEVTPDLAARLQGARLVLFDGTLWQDDEMIRAGLGVKTGGRMGHMSMSGPEGSIAALADLGIAERVFVHINNTNPVHLPSDERAQAQQAGWRIPAVGEEFTL